MKTIDQQISAMRAVYPNLQVVSRSPRTCVWRGRLMPYKKAFTIEVYYKTPLFPEAFTIGGIQPLVQVLDPVLERHPSYEEGPLPHVYENPDNYRLPFLCLFDPYVPEWGIDDCISDTTIPWTERWLINYEFWIATGKWTGGGRHIPKGVSNKTAVRPEEVATSSKEAA